MMMNACAIKMAIRSWKIVLFLIRRGYVSSCNHPFLIGLVFLLTFLHRSFPALFSFLVSTSPVLLCTAVLLGTLLSFGEVSMSGAGENGKATHEFPSLKVNALADSIASDSDTLSSQKFIEYGRGLTERSEGERLLGRKVGTETKEDDIGDYMPLVDESCQEIRDEKMMSAGVDGQSSKITFKKKDVFRKNTVHHNGSKGDIFEAAHGDCQFNVCGVFPNLENAIYEEEEEDDDDDDSPDSESDLGESSPDTSPLLEEVAEELHVSCANLKQSKENDVAVEPYDMENQMDEEDNNNNNYEEEEEETQACKDDESNSVIKWTDDDQQNLSNLRSSEDKRDECLQKLTARRTYRNLSLMHEKDLIDLDGIYSLPNIAPILIKCNNPFDLSDDNFPGSAPPLARNE